MIQPTISGIAPFFIVSNVPATLSFYRDMLGFEVTFRGPAPDNRKPAFSWDAYLEAPDPDALAAEFASRGVRFSVPLGDDDDGLRGFVIEDIDGYGLFFGRLRA